MQMRPVAVCLYALIAFLLVSGLYVVYADPMGGTSEIAPAAEPATDPQETPQVEASPGAADYLRVFAGRSLVIRSPEPLKRVSVTDEQIAYAVIVSPICTQVNPSAL